MGHCFRHYFGASDTPAEQDLTARARLRARHESEVQADRFALAWTSIYRPSDYDGVLGYLQTMRTSLCPDKSGRYARPHELDAGVQIRGAAPKAATDLLVEIATVHQTVSASGKGPLR
jgi:hypothetical protein